MNTTMLSTLVPVIVAIAGGLAFLAYKYPREFAALVPFLFGIDAVLGLLLLAWAASNDETTKAAVDLGVVPVGKLAQLTAATDAVSVSVWWYLALAVAWIYVSFLRSLPTWMPVVADRYRTGQVDAKKE
jgi:hypothetical protein